MKKIFGYFSLALIIFGTNFFIYNISFNMQASPYLSEEQRLDSALMMLKTTVPAYLIFAIIITGVIYWIGKSKK